MSEIDFEFVSVVSFRTGNELVEMHSTEGEDDFEKDKEVVKKETVKEGIRSFSS